MNIYVMCDAEGISGIYQKEQVDSVYPLYKECREYMTRDVNTVIEALKEAGVDRIYVRDAHGSGANIIWDKLSFEAYRYIIGNTVTDRFPRIKDCDGVILFGYHAMAGTYRALFDHSMSSKRIQNYWINGVIAGETAIDAGIAGDKGRPVIMVTGDDLVCKEAKAILPWAVTCELKKSASTYGAQTLSTDKSQFIIKEKTIEAIKRYHEMKPLIYNKPIVLRVEVTERNTLPDTYAKPYMKILDGRTYEVTGDTMEEAFFRQY